jgi:hypothetical protein
VTPRRDGKPRAELWLYLLAAVVYIAVGFVVKEVFAWWSYGAIWLVAFVWLGPRAWQWLRGRIGGGSSAGSGDDA